MVLVLLLLLGLVYLGPAVTQQQQQQKATERTHEGHWDKTKSLRLQGVRAVWLGWIAGVARCTPNCLLLVAWCIA